MHTQSQTHTHTHTHTHTRTHTHQHAPHHTSHHTHTHRLDRLVEIERKKKLVLITTGKGEGGREGEVHGRPYSVSLSVENV